MSQFSGRVAADFLTESLSKEGINFRPRPPSGPSSDAPKGVRRPPSGRHAISGVLDEHVLNMAINRMQDERRTEKEQVVETLKKIEDSDETTEELRVQLQRKEDELRRVSESYSQAKIQLTDLQGKLLECGIDYDPDEDVRAAAFPRIDKLNDMEIDAPEVAALRTSQRRLKEMEAANLELTTELESNKIQLSRATRLSKEATETSERVEAELAGKNDTLSFYLKKNYDLEREVEAMITQVDILTQENEHLQRSGGNPSGVNIDLATSLNSGAQLKEFKQKMIEMERSLHVAKEQSARAVQEKESIVDELKTFEGRLDEKDREIMTAKLETEEVTRKNNELKEDLRLAEIQERETYNKCTAMNEEIQALSEKLLYYERDANRVSEWKERVQKAEEMGADAKTMMDKAMEERDEATAAVGQQKEDFRRKYDKLVMVEKQREELLREVDTLKSYNQTLESQVALLERELRSVEGAELQEQLNNAPNSSNPFAQENVLDLRLKEQEKYIASLQEERDKFKYKTEEYAESRVATVKEELASVQKELTLRGNKLEWFTKELEKTRHELTNATQREADALSKIKQLQREIILQSGGGKSPTHEMEGSRQVQDLTAQLSSLEKEKGLLQERITSVEAERDYLAIRAKRADPNAVDDEDNKDDQILSLRQQLRKELWEAERREEEGYSKIKELEKQLRAERHQENLTHQKQKQNEAGLRSTVDDAMRTASVLGLDLDRAREQIQDLHAKNAELRKEIAGKEKPKSGVVASKPLAEMSERERMVLLTNLLTVKEMTLLPTELLLKQEFNKMKRNLDEKLRDEESHFHTIKLLQREVELQGAKGAAESKTSAKVEAYASRVKILEREKNVADSEVESLRRQMSLLKEEVLTVTDEAQSKVNTITELRRQVNELKHVVQKAKSREVEATNKVSQMQKELSLQESYHSQLQQIIQPYLSSGAVESLKKLDRDILNAVTGTEKAGSSPGSLFPDPNRRPSQRGVSGRRSDAAVEIPKASADVEGSDLLNTLTTLVLPPVPVNALEEQKEIRNSFGDIDKW